MFFNFSLEKNIISKALISLGLFFLKEILAFSANWIDKLYLPNKKYASADANWACPILLFFASAIDNNFQAAIFLGKPLKYFLN